MVASTVFRQEDPAKKAEIETKLAAEVWPVYLKTFEERLGTNNGWLVGGCMTWADLYLAVVLEWIGPQEDAILAQFVKCDALSKRVKSIPQIAEWIKKRPVTAL